SFFKDFRPILVLSMTKRNSLDAFERNLEQAIQQIAPEIHSSAIINTTLIFLALHQQANSQ
ncbi:hypothetical protein AB7931_06930, partial [Streptococcus pyogenes]